MLQIGSQSSIYICLKLRNLSGVHSLYVVVYACNDYDAPCTYTYHVIQELVSIMRWNDGNYWALKSSTEKSHRSLVRIMKKWKVRTLYVHVHMI